ncbi:MAG TPA: Bor family protein [Methyloceanibacter sp.]|nr:Bor family protein [Methyloceanibacter sp.]
MRRMLPLCALMLIAVAGCYHVTVETGLQPSAQVVEKEWAHGFVFGLVPPNTIETKEKCLKGVAKFESQQSFVNGLASFLTSGLYTPFNVKVTCAQ